MNLSKRFNQFSGSKIHRRGNNHFYLKKNYEFFTGTYRAIRILIHTLLSVIYFIAIQSALNESDFSGKWVLILILLFLAFMGNYMKNIKSNFFIGIRTPWTLDNKEVWKKTHELAGKVWFYTGLIVAIVLLFLPEKLMIWITLPVFAIIVLIPVVYSYILFNKIQKSGQE